jgi:hypothetical protein
MMKNQKPTFQILAVTVMILSVTLACSLTPRLGDIGENVKEQVLQTVGSLSTEAVGNLQLTAEAFSAEMGPVIEATLAAIPPGVSIGNGPEDIPVIPDPYGFYGSENRVVYMTTQSIEDAVGFYRQEMPVNDWTETEPSLVIPKIAYLNFVKDLRKAVVTMTTAGDKVAITVMVSEK